MSFVGTANQIGGKLVRPHDVEISHVPGPDSEEAMIDRIVHLGFEVRIEMTLADDEPADRPAHAGAGRGARAPGGPDRLRHGRRARVFDETARSPRTEELALVVSLAAVVAWVMLALLIGLLGMILFATIRQLGGEAGRAAEKREA